VTRGSDTATLMHTAALLTVLQMSAAVNHRVLLTEVVHELTGARKHLQAMSFQLTITKTEMDS